MTEQLQLIFDSSDWQRIVPFTHRRTYLKIEGWLTKRELDAFYATNDDEEREIARELVLNKRMRLIEFFQQEGFAT